MGQFITHTDGAGETELLGLVSTVKALFHGASVEIIQKLGKQRLEALRVFITEEQDALKSAAQAFKLATNSSLSLEALQGLGMARLRELGVKAGIKAGPSDPWADYSINAIIDEVLKSGAGVDSKPGGGDEFAGYDMNASIDAAVIDQAVHRMPKA